MKNKLFCCTLNRKLLLFYCLQATELKAKAEACCLSWCTLPVWSISSPHAKEGLNRGDSAGFSNRQMCTLANVTGWLSKLNLPSPTKCDAALLTVIDLIIVLYLSGRWGSDSNNLLKYIKMSLHTMADFCCKAVLSYDSKLKSAIVVCHVAFFDLKHLLYWWEFPSVNSWQF